MASKMAGDINIEESKTLTLDFEKRGGLIPVVSQDDKTGQVLMLAYTNKTAFDKTVETRKATFWSTSRNELWVKGETSGDYLTVKEILVDCDQDALVYIVTQEGKGACHTKDPKSGEPRKSCFYRSVDRPTNNGDEILRFRSES